MVDWALKTNHLCTVSYTVWHKHWYKHTHTHTHTHTQSDTHACIHTQAAFPLFFRPICIFTWGLNLKLKSRHSNRLCGACQSAQEICEHTMILNGVLNFQLLGQMNNSVKNISLTVFNFTHPPTLSALLQVLSASRFLVPDFPLLVPTLFLSSAALHGMTFPFLSDRNHLWTLSNQISRHNYYFSEDNRPATFSTLHCYLRVPQVSETLFKLHVN